MVPDVGLFVASAPRAPPNSKEQQPGEPHDRQDVGGLARRIGSNGKRGRLGALRPKGGVLGLVDLEKPLWHVRVTLAYP